MIIILRAMDEEIQQFLTAIVDMSVIDWLGSPRYRGRIGGHEVLVSKSGVAR